MKMNPPIWLAVGIGVQLGSIISLFLLNTALPGWLYSLLLICAVALSSALTAWHLPKFPLLGAVATTLPLLAYFLIVTQLYIEPLTAHHLAIVGTLVGASLLGGGLVLIRQNTN